MSESPSPELKALASGLLEEFITYTQNRLDNCESLGETELPSVGSVIKDETLDREGDLLELTARYKDLVSGDGSFYNISLVKQGVLTYEEASRAGKFRRSSRRTFYKNAAEESSLRLKHLTTFKTIVESAE